MDLARELIEQNQVCDMVGVEAYAGIVVESHRFLMEIVKEANRQGVSCGYWVLDLEEECES